MPIQDIYNAAPGIATSRDLTWRGALLKDERFLPGSFIIDGSKSRDNLNTPVVELRAGLLMGRIAASKKFAPSILGLSTVLHDTSVVTTVMTLPATVVTEIARRIGASGTFKIIGPPTANGTVATETVTYSAIASATTITITATSADFAAGSIIAPTDGSETILSFLPNGYPIKATDADGTSRDLDFGPFPIGGVVKSDQLVNWSSDTSVRAYIVAALQAVGEFEFTHLYGL